MKRSLDPWLFLAPPLALLALAYAAICVQAGTPWPWDHVCHEGGRRTLLTTVFYFQHAVRELPVDIVLGVAVAGAIQAFLPSDRERPRGRLLPAALATATMAVCAATLVGSAAMVGGSVTARNLAQMITRPGAELAWGAHWRYHLLSSLALILSAFVLAGLHRAWRHGRFVPLGDTSLFHLALFLFLTFTLVFGPSWEPLFDTLFLGHQARELATQALITLPLALGLSLWVVDRKNGVQAQAGSKSARGVSSFKPIRGAALVAALLGLWLAVGVLVTGAAGQGQTNSLTALLAGHVFEHTFTYAVVTLTAASLCARLAPARSRVPAVVAAEA